jgi:HrpA-like RNA helicase
MVHLSLPPPLAKFILAACLLRCREEALIIAAMLAHDPGAVFVTHLDGPRDRNCDRAPEPSGGPRYDAACRVAHAPFMSRYGDAVSLLCVYETWRANGCRARWAQERFLNHRVLLAARYVPCIRALIHSYSPASY